MLFLHPNALGIIGILRPSGVFCCPRAYGPWAAENALRAENTNDPSSKGCKNLPFSFWINISQHCEVPHREHAHGGSVQILRSRREKPERNSSVRHQPAETQESSGNNVLQAKARKEDGGMAPGGYQIAICQRAGGSQETYEMPGELLR